MDITSSGAEDNSGEVSSSGEELPSSNGVDSGEPEAILMQRGSSKANKPETGSSSKEVINKVIKGEFLSGSSSLCSLYAAVDGHVDLRCLYTVF